MADDSALGGELALALFKLNGQMMGAGDAIARPAGITAAWWQVIGAVLREPKTVAGIGRQMGISRQAVQRIANRLIAEGLLESMPNPAHKRSPLFAPTDKAWEAIERIVPEQTAFSSRMAEAFGRKELEQLVEDLHRLSAVVDETSP